MHSTPTREATVRFPERFRLRAPRGLSAALESLPGAATPLPPNMHAKPCCEAWRQTALPFVMAP